MEASSLTPNSSALLEQNIFQGKLEVENSSRLSVKTQEGDLVTLSSSSLNSLQGYESESLSEDGVVVEEFSSTSLAASGYSIQVQGDLNEEELQAIEDLAARFTPLADRFFNQEDIDLQETGDALTSSLGVLQEIEVELRQTITAEYSESRFSQSPAGGDPYFNAESLQQEELAPPPPPQSGIRDIASLINSVVDTALNKQANKLIGEPGSLTTFEELSELLRNKVGELLKESLEERQTTPQTTEANTGETEDPALLI